MNTKNYLTPTKKYRAVTSALHTLFRLTNSTFELKEFLFRFAKLLCQIVKADTAGILILDPNKNHSVYRARYDKNGSHISEKKTLIRNRLERKIVKKSNNTSFQLF